jgi:hypothetical protein
MIIKDMIGKVEFYLENKKIVHVSCKNNRFYNGYILEINLVKDFIIIKDNILGELPLMFEEINNIEPYNEVRKC